MECHKKDLSNIHLYTEKWKHMERFVFFFFGNNRLLNDTTHL